MIEPWELPDEEIWGAVDAAALMEAFRRSEISEERERRGQITREQCAALLMAVYEGVQKAVQEMCAAAAEFSAAMARFCAPPARPARPRRSRKERALHLTSQPRTLHIAVQANPRPHRPVLDRRPTRTPATRRR